MGPTLNTCRTCAAHPARYPQCLRRVRLHALRALRAQKKGRTGLLRQGLNQDVRKALKDTAVAALAESLRGEVLHHDAAKLPDLTMAWGVLLLLRLLGGTKASR